MIQIIDGFNLQTPTPIDSRIVVSDDTERLAITSKYHGLRVWEQDTNTPYFWDGSTWVSELDLVVTGQGTDNFIPKFKSSNPTEIEDSQISDDGSLVNISNDLKVSNEVTATTFLGNLDSSYLTGTIGLDKISTVGGISDNVLRLVDISGVLVTQWVDISGISIGSSNSTEKVNLKKVVSTNYYSLIVRDTANTLNSTGGTNMDLFTYETDLIISEDSGDVCILAHQGSKENPPYSFHSSNNILGGIYSDNSVSVSYQNIQVGRFDSSGFKTIDGSESSPSISFIDDTNTGIYRPSDNVISFSTDGNETVRMDVNGFKTILGSSTNPSISSFGTKTFGTGIATATSNFEDTGFYFDSGYYGPAAGIVKQLNFATGGGKILSLNNHGINIYTNGTNALPSISFTNIGSQPSGINGGLNYVSLVTGQIERFRVEGGSSIPKNSGDIFLHGHIKVEDNLYLPQPNASTPSAGKVLTSVDSTGKVKWSENPVALHAPDYYYYTGTSYSNNSSTNLTLVDENFKTDGRKYIVYITAKVVVSSNSGDTGGNNTGTVAHRLFIDGDEKDKSNFYLHIEDKEIKVWTTTLICTWIGEITANGQTLVTKGGKEESYQSNWVPKLSILYIPVT